MDQGILIEKGRKQTITIIVIKIVAGIANLILSFSILQVISFILACVLVAALFRGVVWVKYYFIVVGIISVLFSCIRISPYLQYLDILPIWYMLLLIIAYMIDITIIIFLSASESIKAFLYYQKYGDEIATQANSRQLQSSVNELDVAYQNTKPCPFCGEQIAIEHKFCHMCGGNIDEKEEENKKALLEKYKQNGIGSLFEDETIADEAAMYRRIYGKAACLSYLKEKAKAMGFDDSEITEADVDNILIM